MSDRTGVGVAAVAGAGRGVDSGAGGFVTAESVRAKIAGAWATGGSVTATAAVWPGPINVLAVHPSPSAATKLAAHAEARSRRRRVSTR
jgi:hypothetical protein